MADELAATTEALRLDDSSKADHVGLEEGEIFEKPMDRPAEPKKHPLEHSWTFWFDNPNGKQKQATWGSSLRPVYTFHTVEEFWWYVKELSIDITPWHCRALSAQGFGRQIFWIRVTCHG